MNSESVGTDNGPSVGLDGGDRLIAVAARLTRAGSAVLGKQSVRLTFRQHRTLVRVIEGKRSMSQIAAISGLSLPTISENVDGLVRRGLLRTEPSPTDGRAVLLSATKTGIAAADAASAALRHMSRRFFLTLLLITILSI